MYLDIHTVMMNFMIQLLVGKNMHEVNVEKEWITLTYGTVSTLHYVVQAFVRKVIV